MLFRIRSNSLTRARRKRDSLSARILRRKWLQKLVRARRKFRTSAPQERKSQPLCHSLRIKHLLRKTVRQEKARLLPPAKLQENLGTAGMKWAQELPQRRIFRLSVRRHGRNRYISLLQKVQYLLCQTAQQEKSCPPPERLRSIFPAVQIRHSRKYSVFRKCRLWLRE